MKFISILLKEGRREDLKKKYANKFKETDLDWILNISDLVDFNHKYSDFVLKNVDPNSQTFDEDVHTAVEIVKDFDKYQPNLEKRDINQYNNLWDLDLVLEPIKAKEKERELEKQVDKIYEDDKFLVIQPKSHKASCKYGANTKWCTTAQSPDHFQRYTSGSQALYYIINKANSTNKDYSKIAIHFDNSGDKRYWDSKDSPMTDREIAVFNYAFPDIISAIEENYKLRKESSEQKLLNEIFNSRGITKKSDKKLFGTNSQLTAVVEGFQTISDLGPGHAEGSLAIVLNDVLIDDYQVFVTFKLNNSEIFETSIGFMGKDNYIEEDYFIDLGLEDFGFDARFKILTTPQDTAENVRNYIANRSFNKVIENTKLREKVVGSGKFFTPTYGYTFGKNKGWVKKLVDFLDSGKIGTKLDFLQDVGYIEKETRDGKTQFRKKKGGFLYNPRDLRGQHASFFAAAKNAGILGYRKVGREFFLIKGPNFDAFKKGELKAL